MRTRIQPYFMLDDSALLRPSFIRRAIAWITLVAYVGQPLAVTAQVAADQAAAPSNRPVIDTAANGLPLVQITSPSAAGVSHNQYTQFNVDPAGLILNNSPTVVLTQQAGYVIANPNLVNGAARVILNEVTSTNISQLNGYTEVAGQRAEVIIANPNGITCNGCGFINTGRGVLTTGTPVMGAGGSLDAFRVTGGQIQIGTAGMNGSNLSQINLIARSVKMNGELWATDLNVSTGANLVNYNTLGVQLIQGDANKPTVGIDVALLGGMYANKIRLLGTEAGVGVNSLGNLSAQAGDFTLDNQGQITLGGNTTASGPSTSSGQAKLIINSNTGITNNGTLYSQQAAQLTSAGSITNSGLLSAQGNLSINAASLNSSGTLGAGIDVNGNATQNGNILITTQNQATATGQNISGGNMNIAAAGINLASSHTNAWNGVTLNATAGNIDLTSAWTQSAGNIVLNATDAVTNNNGLLFGAQVASNAANFNNTGGSLGALGEISLMANAIDNTNGQIGNAFNGAGNVTLTTTGNLTNTGGQIDSDQDLFITANTLIGNGLAIAGRDASINLQGSYTNAAGNVLKANRDLIFTATGDFNNQTALEAVGTLSVNAASISNQAGAGINSDWTVLNTAGDITNAGRIEGNTVETHSNNLTNTATVMGDVLNLYANNLNNLNATALIAATQNVNLIIANVLNNQDGATLYSLGDINIGSNMLLDANGYLTGNAASVSNQSATIDATGSLRVSANMITNKRTVVGVEWGSTRAGAYVPGNPRYTSYFADQQFTAATTAASQILSGANMWISGGALTNDYSTIIAGGALTSQLITLTNTGAPFQRSETRVGQQDVVQWLPTGATRCNAIGMNCSPVWGWVTVTTAYAPAPIYTSVPGSVNVSYLQNTQHGGTPHTVNTSGVMAGGVANVAPINSGALPALTVPSSGLYTIYSQPGQKYLVVTDPRFTSYQNFVSSDYMLSRLVLDSQQIQKRLGDGFYEQKLVSDQITAQTGRRYLGEYTDSQSQFIALLDAGMKTAKDIQLVPGIALTSKQIDALTQDIVWMVEREVTLPNGSTERVLAPQVYLTRLSVANMTSGGALIAANDVRVTASDGITNSGTIQGRASTVLNAQDITNQGGVIGSQGFTLLTADNDIFNVSGRINGKTVDLTAGRDIRNERTSRDITRTVNLGSQSSAGLGAFRIAPVIGVGNSTELGLEAGISATDTLSINAGRDVSIVAASINSGGDAAINTGRDLTVGVLTAKDSSSTSRYSAYRTDVIQLGSNIQAGGSLNLSAGNDMRLTSAALDAGKNATLIAGGDLTLAASKNSTSFGFDTGVVQQRNYDETVLGSILNAGGNVTLAAIDGKGQWARDKGGNITLESAAISSKNGPSTSSGQAKLTVVADGNVNVGSVEEKHEYFQQMRLESSSWFSSTTTTIRDESTRIDAIGSNLDSDRITIQSGRNINVTGSNVVAKQDITLAAMTDINILAATETYKQNHSREEVTNGLITGGTFGFTIGQDKSTTQTNTDGATQSQSRSTLNSTSGNLNLLSGGNTIIAGSDLAATQGAFTAAAGSSIAVFAGLDSLNQYTESHHDQDTGIFSKQKRTTTDTLIQSQYAGSALAANTIDLQAGANLILQAAKLNSTGNTTLAAAGDVQLLSVADSIYTNHTEKLQTEGVDLFNPVVALADRRKNSQTTGQVQIVQVTDIQSGGNLNSNSGGNTLIEASTLNANGSIDLTAGYNANGQAIKPEATLTFAAVKDSTYLKVDDNHSSLAWQNQSGNGDYQEAIKLANISAGKGLSVNATGGVIVDIPEVPAPAEITPPADSNSVNSASSKQGAGANNTAAANTDIRTPQQRFDDHLNTLAQQPGQAWIGQLANDPRTKVQWQQINAAVEHWDYSHEGLTPEAAGVIAVVVAYASAGAASNAAAGIVSSASATTGVALSAAASAAATSAVTAGLITLASQASVSLANNKGDIGRTLDDLGKKESVRNIVAAMLTAGVAGSYGSAQNFERFSAQTLTGCITGDMTGRGCESGATTAAIMTGSEWVNHEMRVVMAEDSKKFNGVQDINDPSGKIYNNMTGGGSTGIDGDGTRESGTRISIKGLKEFGTMTPVTPGDPNTLWTFSGFDDPKTMNPFSLTDALTAQGGFTGGTQALGQTFFGIHVVPGSFMDKLQESFAGPHDYFGGRLEGGYDSLGNWKVTSDFADGVREIAAAGNIVLVVPLVIPTLLRQIHIDPVAINNIVQNNTQEP